MEPEAPRIPAGRAVNPLAMEVKIIKYLFIK